MTSASKHGKFENLEKFIFSAINVLEPPYSIPSFLHTYLPHGHYPTSPRKIT